MEQHPIPQQISSYEFKLVGSMTLKQFGKLAVGLIIAFLFYSSKLSFFFKWPLVLSFGSLGFALAFVPVNERPLEIFIFSFFKSVFSPTIYTWNNQGQNINILDTGLSQKVLKGQEKEKEEKERREQEIKKEIETAKKPKLNEFISSIPKEDSEPKSAEEGLRKKTPTLSRRLSGGQPLSENNQKTVRFEEKVLKEPIFQEKPFSVPSRSAPPKATADPDFGEIPMPKPPTTPNLIVGMVIDHKGKILENAIVEIQDEDGNPTRALRTNQIGQFRTTAPLPNGSYLIITEKQSFNFDIIKIKAEGGVIPPLKIKANISLKN